MITDGNFFLPYVYLFLFTPFLLLFSLFVKFCVEDSQLEKTLLVPGHK